MTSGSTPGPSHSVRFSSVDGSTPVTSFGVYDQTFGLDFQERELLLAA